MSVATKNRFALLDDGEEEEKPVVTATKKSEPQKQTKKNANVKIQETPKQNGGVEDGGWGNDASTVSKSRGSGGRGRGGEGRGGRGGGKSGGGGSDRACFKCGETGHMSKECPNPPTEKSGGGGDRTCYKCGETGHLSRECPNQQQSGDRTCYKCGETGHLSRECPNPESTGNNTYGGNPEKTCFKCNQPGHFSRECPNVSKPSGGGDRGCYKCGETGHLARECPNTDPAAERKGRRNDRKSATGLTDSNKKIHQSWGDDDGKQELEAEQNAEKDALAEANGNVAEDDGWGGTTSAAPPAENEDGEAKGDLDLKEKVEEEEEGITLDEYLAERKGVSSVAALETRQVDSTIPKGMKVAEKTEEESMFTLKEKATRQRQKKAAKETIEIEAKFAPPSGGRGRRGGGDDRGARRGAGRGAQRGRSGQLAPATEDLSAFPALA